MQSGKNILFILPSFYPGGAERVSISIANWIVANTNDIVYFISISNIEPKYTLNTKIKVIYCEEFHRDILRRYFERLKFIKNNISNIKPDIIFSLFERSTFYCIMSNVKESVIISSERANLKKRSIFRKIICLYTSKRCDGFIFQTEGAKFTYPLSVQKKSIVISNAISNQLVYNCTNDHNEKVITAMGRLTDQKGFDVLIRAFDKVSKTHLDYKLIIFGEGEKRFELEKLISQLDLNDKIILPGNDINAIKKISKSQIFVLSSRYEGMPNALIEAMAVGTACISANCDFGPRDLIINNKNGILVPVDNQNMLTSKINYLIENPVKRKKLEREAIKVRNILDENIICEQYYDYFNKVFLEKNSESSKLKLFSDRLINYLLSTNIGNLLNDKFYLSLRYKIRIGHKIDLNNPQGFNEKLQWLKLYDRNPKYINMVDKYEVRNHIKNTIGENYLIPLIGVYNNFDEIDFNKLPNQFVIKSTHDSGGVVICKDKKNFDIEKCRKRINKCLKKNYFYSGREWPYKNIKPRIVIEKYMDDGINTQLNDYKLMCFNGKVKCSFVCSERDNKEKGLAVTFFDTKWKKMPFERHYRSSNEVINKPKNYDKMVELAEILSENIPFVRVDFYEIKGKIYFGELTFYPGCGFEEFNPYEWDIKLGSWIKLPDKRCDND